MTILRPPVRALALLLPTLFVPAAALASAHASLQVTGQDHFDVSLSAAAGPGGFNYAFFSVALQPLETVTRTFQYTVTVADDGLPATRTDTICTPDIFADCGPAPTGYELAYALIELGRDRRATSEQNIWVDDNGFSQSFQSVTGSPHTYTGTITYTATDTSPYVPQFVDLSVYLFAVVDASPVPEPGTWGFAVLGLLPLLARTRRGAPGR